MLYNWPNQIITKKFLEGLWRLQNSSTSNSHCKCPGDLVLLIKEQTVLQGMNDKITEIGRWFEMEMNVFK
jgi:hypothetical protein